MMKFTLVVILSQMVYVGITSAFIVTAGSYPAMSTDNALVTAADLVRVNTPIPSTLQTSIVVQAPVSAAVTSAPPVPERVIRRQTQKCFNDQGFQVDCATWTGYYYSWGPPGNPYEGGPGDGQGDSSNSGSDGGTLVFQSAAAYLQQLSPAITAALCFLVLAMFL